MSDISTQMLLELMSKQMHGRIQKLKIHKHGAGEGNF